MNADMIRRCTGAKFARADLFAPHITAAMAEFGIETHEQQARFLAQIGHESGGLRYTVELWGPTPAQARYEGRVDLGNVRPGDGYRFRGRGLIQTTGRANYARTGNALGIDLEADPDLLGEPELAARSAGCFWQARNLNAITDFRLLTRKINGGYNGLAERQALWASAKTALGVA
jgi:putative chitinase